MRRKDREITDRRRIDEVIAACRCCRIGFSDNGRVYIVPLNFGYLSGDGQSVFYFHGAREGRKIDLIQSAPAVGFELDTNYKLNEAAEACDYSARFQSVIGNGIVSMVEDSEEKKAGLQSIMMQSTGKGEWSFSEQMLNSVCVFKLVVETMSCKEHL